MWGEEMRVAEQHRRCAGGVGASPGGRWHSSRARRACRRLWGGIAMTSATTIGGVGGGARGGVAPQVRRQHRSITMRAAQ